MKKLLRLMALSAMVATLWLPALAQNTQSQTTTATTTQSDEDAKAALYQRFLDLYKTDPKAANEVAKEYLQKYPAESAQTAYLKKWIAAYEAKEKNDRKADVEKMFTNKQYNEAFTLAKQILSTEPEDLRTLNNAVAAALYAKNDSINAEASGYAKKAIRIIEAGKPFDKRDDTLGWLNSAIGFFALKSNPSEAVTYYIKAAQGPGTSQKDPLTYTLLAESYRNAEYVKLAGDIKARCSTAEQQATPECKALTDRLNAVVDRMIDAYARAIALATDAKYATLKADAMKDLTPLYKYRHEGSEAGLTELIAGVLSKPLPTEPIAPSGTASTAPSTSQTTNAATTGNTAATTTTNTAGTTTNTNSTPATTTTPKTTTTPASTTTTPGKSPRR